MLEKNKFYCGDNRELIKKIDQNVVDMYIFSPPYGSIRDYDNKNYIFDYSFLGDEIYRTLKDGGVCVVIISDQVKNFAKDIITFKMVVDWVENKNLKLFENLIWAKPGRPGPWWNKRFRLDHEYILIFFKGEKPKYFNKDHTMIPSKYANKKVIFSQRKTDGSLEKQNRIIKEKKCKGTIWNFHTSCNDKIKEKLNHPATFPEKLCDDLIKCFTEENDLVIDIFCGSGTSCISAYKNKRNFIGIDISQKYIDLCYEIFNRYYKEIDEFFDVDHHKI